MNKTEKLTLLMLCEIYEHLNIQGGINHKVVKSAVMSDNLWAIEREHNWLSEDEISEHIQKSVDDSLTAYRFLSSSLRNLPESDQAELIAKFNLKFEKKYIQFPGYDGNNEVEHLSVASMLRELGLYDEQLELNKNSHEENNGNYSALKLFLDGFNSSEKLKLSKADLEEALSLCPNFD
ncbi:YfbU family protein [Moellerella wisconsensis]|uniref:YfbU family protein n=1 Tax=Moellerella wisconsensis TaxID=158849 RepID=UPI003076462B